MALFKLTVIKSMLYRGETEEWSNSYTFSGTDPADAAAWLAWANKVRDLEKPVLPATQTFERWYGYNSGHWETKPQHIDASGDYAAGQVGTLSVGSGIYTPGDVAFWVRWDTGQYTSRGKKIYLRKYFHGAIGSNLTGVDDVLAAQRTAAATYAAAMYDGTSLIGTARMARDTGTLPIAHSVGTNTTTRTLKRRGKRNPT